MRWLFHLVRTRELHFDAERRYAPPAFASEGFVHASYQPALRESARLHFAGVPGEELTLLRIDPRRLDVPVEIADTPRGPMPHLHGRIPEDAVERLPLDAIDAQPDRITGTRIGFAAFAGMTLLDLIGPLDALSRIASMSFDPTTSSEVFALDDAAPIWSGSGLEVRALRRRPRLDAFDVLVVPGGFGTRTLVRDAGALAYLSTFPANRLLASVCTGALVLGAMGRLRGKPATTHASALDELTGYGATVRRERVVQADNVITAGGVTSGIDLGLALVARLTDAGVADAIARQMEVQSLQHSSATPLLA